MKAQRRLHSQGLTLIEVLIAMALMSLLASTALALMTYSSKLLTRTQARSDHNRALGHTYLDLAERFFHTTHAYQSTSPNGDVLTLATARDRNGKFLTDEQGYPRWSAWEQVAVRDHKLGLWRTDSNDFTQPPASPAAGSRAFNIIAHGVDDFNATIGADHAVHMKINWSNEQDEVPTEWTFRAGQGGVL